MIRLTYEQSSWSMHLCIYASMHLCIYVSMCWKRWTDEQKTCQNHIWHMTYHLPGPRHIHGAEGDQRLKNGFAKTSEPVWHKLCVFCVFLVGKNRIFWCICRCFVLFSYTVYCWTVIPLLCPLQYELLSTPGFLTVLLERVKDSVADKSLYCNGQSVTDKVRTRYCHKRRGSAICDGDFVACHIYRMS
jgi:hypothetical protein